MSSALFQEIREKKGLAYTVYSSLSPFYDSGVFSVYTATGPAQVPLCIKLIEECVTKLSRECLSEADLQVVKDNLKGTVLLSADNVESRMQSIAKAEIFFGTYFPVEQICEWIDQVKPADVRRVARRIFSQGKRTMIFLGPRPSASVRRKIGPKILKK
jgi:predicted Zn-dependent peptidase